jgi:predicted XRE-type DNA-binding protein
MGQHRDIASLVHSVSDDPLATERVVSRMQSRSILDFLVARRALAGMNQSEIAKAMRYTQSRVSKLENGTDNELTIADVHADCSVTARSTTSAWKK